MIRSSRIGLAHTLLAVFAIAILVQGVRVQILQYETWSDRASRQQRSETPLPAPRGEIHDASGRVLVESRDQVRLEIAPNEVRDPKRLRAALQKLGVDRALIDRATNPKARYLTIPGRFSTTAAAPATLLRGVHAFPSQSRSYAVSEGARGILGHVDAQGKPVDGVELSLDEVLRGTPGEAAAVRDSRGRRRESPTAPSVDPTQGNTIVLTINADLQEIAEKSLADAVQRMGAEGGDIVILDPRSGEILAMASRRLDPRQTSATVITEPFEPGSTFKPFIAAGLLERHRVKDTDSVDTGNGVLEVKGRKNPIRDDHLIGKAPLSTVLRWSSNIGIIKFAARLTPDEEYETIRDFGFGTPTGLPYPTESGGILSSPRTWSSQSAISMAMGYEVAVTPLQLAAAYGVFANGGRLMQPSLIKRIVAPDGSVRYEHRPRVVRQVVSQATADKVRRLLLDVVDEGTALEAALDDYMLAGKTGTPRSTVRGRYVAGRYNPNFVSLFPGDNPQYVIVVKMTAPRSSIYASKTAAPVTKTILQAAIAAQNAALDRMQLASSARPVKRDSVRQSGDPRQIAIATQGAETVAVAPRPVREDRRSAVPFVVTLPSAGEKPAPRPARVVPDVRGLVLRDAVRSLHNAGFRVQLGPGNTARGTGATVPAAGAMAPAGSLVRLTFDH